MIASGESNMVAGATALYNHFQGTGTSGFDPLRYGFNQVIPQGWGNSAYDGINLIASIAALNAPVPLKVGFSDGINRTGSLFGATVPRFGNATLNPFTGLPSPYGVTQATLLYGVGTNGTKIINDTREKP